MKIRWNHSYFAFVFARRTRRRKELQDVKDQFRGASLTSESSSFSLPLFLNKKKLSLSSAWSSNLRSKSSSNSVKDEKEIQASDFLSNPCKWKFKLGLGFLFLVELLLAPRIEFGFGQKNPCPSLGFFLNLKSFAKLLLALRVAQRGL